MRYEWRDMSATKKPGDVITADFTEHDPHRMMHTCGLDKGFVDQPK